MGRNTPCGVISVLRTTSLEMIVRVSYFHILTVAAGWQLSILKGALPRESNYSHFLADDSWENKRCRLHVRVKYLDSGSQLPNYEPSQVSLESRGLKGFPSESNKFRNNWKITVTFTCESSVYVSLGCRFSHYTINVYIILRGKEKSKRKHLTWV